MVRVALDSDGGGAIRAVSGGASADDPRSGFCKPLLHSFFAVGAEVCQTRGHLDVKGARFALSTTAQPRGVHFIGRFPTVYFQVPADLGAFRVTISSASTDESAAADLIDPEERTVASLDTYGRLTAQALVNSGSRGGYWRPQRKRPWLPHMHNVWVQLDERLPPWVVVSPPQALEVGAAN
jgi:hypothetical protein